MALGYGEHAVAKFFQVERLGKRPRGITVIFRDTRVSLNTV